MMEHTSYINKTKVTFVLVPGKAVDAILKSFRRNEKLDFTIK